MLLNDEQKVKYEHELQVVFNSAYIFVGDFNVLREFSQSFLWRSRHGVETANQTQNSRNRVVSLKVALYLWKIRNSLFGLVELDMLQSKRQCGGGGNKGQNREV